jgi:hypothetical protein
MPAFRREGGLRGQATRFLRFLLLLLRRSDKTIVMLGVLQVAFSGY